MSEIGIKDQCFGVEVEMSGITREQAANALAEYFESTAIHTGGSYDKWSVTDREGKVWTLMSDSSIHARRKVGSQYTSTTDRRYQVEMVTPKLTYAELPKLQECVRRVRKAGARENSSCGHPRPCGWGQPQPSKPEEPPWDHVFQGGHFVQGIAGQRGPC